MNEKERKILESLSKHLGVEDVISPSIYIPDEEKRLKEEKLLKKWSKLLGESEPEPMTEQQIKEELLLTNFTNHLEATTKIIEEIESPNLEVLDEKTFVNAALDNAKIITQPTFSAVEKQPELPEKDFVTKSVEMLSKTTKKTSDLPTNDPIRNEITQLKKSMADLHHFASRMSSMGGGGEVNLRYLDDIDRSTITDGHYLRYDAASKKFVFDTFGYISTAYVGANLALSSATTVYTVPTGTAIGNTRHVSIGSNNDFIISETGNYTITYSLQLINTDISDVDIYIWLRKNTVDIADSSSVFSVPPKKSSNDPGKLIAITPTFIQVANGDSIQIMMASPDNTTCTLSTIGARTSPTIPRTPAALIQIRQDN